MDLGSERFAEERCLEVAGRAAVRATLSEPSSFLVMPSAQGVDVRTATPEAQTAVRPDQDEAVNFAQWGLTAARNILTRFMAFCTFTVISAPILKTKYEL